MFAFSYGGANSTAVKFLMEKRVDGAIVAAHNISQEIIAGNPRKEFPIILGEPLCRQFGGR